MVLIQPILVQYADGTVFICVNQKHGIMFRTTFLTYEPSFLTKKEIRDPFLVLKKTYRDLPNCEPIIDECWDLWTTAFRENYWMNHQSPKALYKKCLKLLRLLDAGWLIAKIRPAGINKGDITKVFDPKSGNIIEKDLGELTNAYKIIHNSYNQSTRFDLGFELYNVFYQGLMPTSINFEDILVETVYSSFKEITSLISALFIVHRSEIGTKRTSEDKALLSLYIKFALDFDIPQFSYYDSISHMFEAFNKQQYFSIIKYLASTSCSNFFWKNNGNPANVLYYMEELQFIMETMWSYLKDEGDNIKMKIWEIPADEIKQVQFLPQEALKNPLIYLSEEFAKRDLSDRRNDLHEWRLAVLDNRWYNADAHKDIEQFLSCVVEVADLLKFISFDV